MIFTLLFYLFLDNKDIFLQLWGLLLPLVGQDSVPLNITLLLLLDHTQALQDWKEIYLFIKAVKAAFFKHM